ncbi:hypothetical protein O4J56_31075 [Nocardiopsis sp. RSe5-2]|uniref:Secreted protein n=1 Tax=Nocardiopsis endophytica TaxID=3018445 RepID=A0ABT4UDR2_9ACTN|nr:hypothetical protein [Nocardiopsis endophytica]MDA2815125.1 hypothetical protein [Nocardiopsis endophytica]
MPSPESPIGRSAVAVALSGACLALAAAAPASAAPAPSAPDLPEAAPAKVVQVPMEAANIVSAAPDTDGEGATARLDNGQSIELTEEAYDHWTENKDDVATKDLVVGDCGYSFLWLFSTGNRGYMVWTGFHVNQNAWFYGWESAVIGAGDTRYEQTFEDGGVLDSQDWSQDYYGMVPATDLYDGMVDNGWAFLSNLQICTALGPNDTQWIQ